MPLPALRPIDLTIPTPVSDYLKKITPFCPFIEPAARADCLHGCVITPDCQTPEEIDPRLFEQLVPLVERFRDARRALPIKNQRLLISHTVVIHMPPHLDVETARRLVWPNWVVWALKATVYTKGTSLRDRQKECGRAVVQRIAASRAAVSCGRHSLARG